MKKENFATFWRGVKVEGEGDWNVIDGTGCSHESPLNALCYWLGFCGCGQPEVALQTVIDVLILYDYTDGKGWSAEEYERTKAREAEIFGTNGGIPYLIWYWLSDLDLLEHGGTVPGWLTVDGQLFLQTATKLLAEESKVESL